MPVHVFIGSAAAGPTNHFSFPVGERHAILVFSLQEEGIDFDWNEAMRLATARGWNDVDIKRGGIVGPEFMDESTQHLVPAYEEANSSGSSMFVYTDPISP